MQLTFEDAVRELRRAVEIRGADYVYPAEMKTQVGSCQYVYDGEPACLIGQVFHQLGLPIDEIVRRRAQTKAADVVAQDVFGIKADRATEMLLRHAQSRQDYGRPWGEAVEDSLRAIRIQGKFFKDVVDE